MGQMRHYIETEFRRLRNRVSKHSHYQIVHSACGLQHLDHIDAVRYEKERTEFIYQYVNCSDKRVLDIGCNTGYFVIESCLQGASSVDAFEPNPELARISEICCEAAGFVDRVVVHRAVFDFSKNDLAHFDVCLLQNVLHHIGDDFFQESQLGQGETLNLIADILVGMANVADQIVLQLGFNWKGDTSKPLFADGTKEEMIQFVQQAVDGIFDIEAIGIAEMSADGITYQKPQAKNIDRDDLLGEFLNRPIFILRKPRVE